MGLKPRYKSDYKQYIITALQVMIDNLCIRLQIVEGSSFRLDTEEEHRKLFAGLCCQTPPSPEELRQSVEEARDESIQELGHIQKRIDEVRVLKEVFKGPEVPSPQILNKTYGTLRSSLIHEAMDLCMGNPREKVFATGIAGLDKEKAEEVERIGKNIQAYSEALMFGFNMSTFFWNEFPFDSP